MARKKKSEGEEVRVALDGPAIEHDELIGFIEARNREDHQRSSSAGESRNKIKEFLDETNMNSQALSWCRSIMKKPDQAKAMDVIRSLEAALPMVKAHVSGQSTPDMFPDDEQEPVEPATELPKPSYAAQFDAMGDPDIKEDADDFERHLAQAAAE